MKKYLYCFLVLFISISDAQVSAGGRMDAAVSYEDAIADRDFDALYDYFERQWRDRPQLGSEAATGIPTIVYERAQRATDREELKVLYDFTNQRFRSDPRSRQYIAPIRREHLGAEFRAINGVNDPQAIEQFIHYYHYVVGSEGGRSGWESELQQVETRMKGLYWGAALSADNEQAIAEFMTRFPDYWPAQRQQYGIRIEAHVEDKDIDGLRLLAEEVNQQVADFNNRRTAHGMIDDGIQRVEAILADIAAVDVEREQAAWEEAVVANTEIAFQQFVVDFPDSSRVEEAKIRGSVLRWDATEAAAAVLAQIPPNWRDRGLVIRDGVDDLHGMTVENFFVRPFRHEIDEVGDEATTLIAKLGSLSFGQATASVEIDLSQFGSPAARIRFELELSWGGVVRIVSATIQNYQTNRRETGSDFNFIFMTVALVNQLFVPDFR